jgi:hypothetical protein
VFDWWVTSKERERIMVSDVFHLCIDPVDNALAEKLGEQAGLEVQTLFPKEGIFPADAKGLIIRLDHIGLTPLERAQLLRRLETAMLPYPVILVTYECPEPETLDALQERGVLVCKNLSEELFAQFARLIGKGKSDEAA